MTSLWIRDKPGFRERPLPDANVSGHPSSVMFWSSLRDFRSNAPERFAVVFVLPVNIRHSRNDGADAVGVILVGQRENLTDVRGAFPFSHHRVPHVDRSRDEQRCRLLSSRFSCRPAFY